VAIKVNLLPREAAPRRAGLGLRLPAVSVGANVYVQAGTALLVLSAVVVGGLGWMAYRDRAAEQRALARLKERDADLQRQLAELRAVEAARREIRRRLDILGRVAKSQGVPAAVMTGVLRAVPQGVWLTTLDMKPREVKVRVEGPRASLAASSETLAKLEEKRQEAIAAAPARRPPGKPEVREVTELEGFAIRIRGMAFNNFQVAQFMENLRQAGVFTEVDFTETAATTLEQVRVVSFEVTADVKL